MRRATLLLFAALLPLAASADLEGRVVAVHDGDSLTLLVEKQKIRVRLDGIDAPEIGQRYGKSSRAALAKLCRGKDAKVVERGKDEEGRIVGSVHCNGVDASAEQVRHGMAWVHMRYLPFGAPLYELETNARLRGVGLWQDSDPVPPWEWRKTRR